MREELKRNCNLSDTFINRIDYLTYFDCLLPDKKKEHENTLNSTYNHMLYANQNCRYFGRYYKKGSLTIWIGYDFRNNQGRRFYFQIYKPNSDQIKKINDSKLNYERIISKFDQNNSWYNFYLDEALIYLQGASPNDEENFDNAKQEIWDMIKSVLNTINQ